MVTQGDTNPETPYGVEPGYKVNLGRLPNWQQQPQARGDNLGGVVLGGNFRGSKVWAYPQIYEEDVLRVGRMSEGNRLALQDKLAVLGYIRGTVNPGDIGQIEAAYKSAMADANHVGAKSVNRYLDDKLRMYAASGGLGSGDSGSGGSGSGGSTTYSSTSISNQSMVSRSVNLTGRGTAEGILRSALQQQLGRAPSKKEVSDFKRALNRKERRNPTITRSNSSTTTNTTTTTKGKSQSSTSNTSGSSKSVTKQSDIDPGEEALDFATSSKALRRERNRYQDAQYMDVLSNMLGL